MPWRRMQRAAEVEKSGGWTRGGEERKWGSGEVNEKQAEKAVV